MKLFSRLVKTTLLAATFCTAYSITSNFEKLISEPRIPAPITVPRVTGFAIGVTQGMLNLGLDRNELAFLISHELAHVDLGHTERDSHFVSDEYHADVLAVYYMELAGYNPCAASGMWKRLAVMDTSISNPTHPDSMRRAHYMKLSKCRHYVRGPNVTTEEAYQVFDVLSLKLRPKLRDYTSFQIIEDEADINAYAQAVYK